MPTCLLVMGPALVGGTEKTDTTPSPHLGALPNFLFTVKPVTHVVIFFFTYDHFLFFQSIFFSMFQNCVFEELSVKEQV